MKAQEIFDICYARYRGCRGLLAGQMAAMDLDTPSDGYHWRPSRARADDYVADFETIGQRALRRPEWKGRLKLFQLYYLRRLEYRRVQTLVGVAQGTFDYWHQEVKKALGREFSRTGLFPPSRYFHCRGE